MKAKFKKVWLKALRGGGYRQTQTTLKSKYNGKRPAYCCLGVLLACNKRKIPMLGLGSLRGTLTDLEREEFGITLNQHEKLVHMNDTLGYSFKKIANWIEKNL